MTGPRSKKTDRRMAMAVAVAVWVVGLIPAAVAAPSPPEGCARDQADFNGDGFSDLAVGAPYEDLNGETDAGVVHVIYGTASGLSSTVRIGSSGSDQLWSQDSTGIEGFTDPDDHFGNALAVGDFDGDGFDDLSVGVPGENDQTGVVHVIYGTASGLSSMARIGGSGGAQLWSQDSTGIEGEAQVWDEFGKALAVGDFDTDGFDDLSVGAWGDYEPVGGEGVVNVIYGTASGLTSSGDQLWSQHSPATGNGIVDGFGGALTVGDFDCDGFDDLAVGAPNAGVVFSGTVDVIYGTASGLSSSGVQVWSQTSPGIEDLAEDSDKFGKALTMGDFNGDGFHDLAVGVPHEGLEGQDRAGVVHVIYGTASGLSSTGDQLWSQASSGIADELEKDDWFGRALTMGDFNGDGLDDMAVGVPMEDIVGVLGGTVSNAGVAHVIYGTASGLSSIGDQLWSQDSSGIDGIAEAGDGFGGFGAEAWAW